VTGAVSFESRWWLVSLVLAGQSPRAAATGCGASRATGYRLWRRYQAGGGAVELEQRILAVCAYAQRGRWSSPRKTSSAHVGIGAARLGGGVLGLFVFGRRRSSTRS
jgi:hypothetical protein